MRSAVVVAVDSRKPRVADVPRGNMKLPVSVLVLVAVQAALAKSLKQKIDQTSKRELLEGNFGERNALLSKYAASAAPGIRYAEDINEELSDQSPAHQIFGARLPQIAKISDVLTGQGPPFEVAVANHLYAPVSVYQARLSSPTTFEIPSPAASQIAFSNPKLYKPRKQAKEQKLPELPPKEVEQPRYNVNVPVYAVKQPRFRFESYPRPFAHGAQQSNTQNMYQQPAPQLFPVYDETNRYTGHVVSPQYLQQQQGIIQIVPYDPGYDYVNMEDKDYANQESREDIKQEAAERPKLQAEIPQPRPGYHAHPNGAISFASFTQGLPSKTQQAALKPQPVEAQVQQQADQSSQIQSQQPIPSEFYPQNGQQQTAKEGLHYPPIFQQYLRQLQKFQPFEQEVKFRSVSQSSPQLMTYNVPMRQHPKNLNPLRQQLLVESPQQFLQAFQFQRIPAFKPMPRTRLTSESHYQPTITPPKTQEPVPQFKSLPQPKPFGYHGLPAQNPIQFNQPIVPVLPQRPLTPLPPLKPNYNQSVKPLVYNTPPAFLPTPVLPLPTSTPKLHSATDQVISSTTIHPTVNQELTVDQEQKKQLIQQQTETPKLLEPGINYQSQSTVLPLQQISVTAQPTTYRPSSTYEPHSKYEQQSTPQPQYQSTVHPQPTQYQSTVNPQPTQTPPRHEVVIQQQELQELILESSPQPLDTHSLSHQRQQPNPSQQHEQELYQLQSQQHQNYLEQLQPQLYQQIVHELRSQQHQRDARQREESIQTQRQQHEAQIEFQQYQNQQHSQPLQQFLQQQVHSQQQQEQIQSRQEQNRQQIENKDYEQKLQLEPENAIQQQLSTPHPSDEPLKEPELQSDDQQQTEPQTIESEEQTEPSHAPSESKPPAPNAEEPFFGPNYPIFQQLYTQPQELLVHPEYGSPLGMHSLPDVQYFGKYAESIFNGQQH